MAPHYWSEISLLLSIFYGVYCVVQYAKKCATFNCLDLPRYRRDFLGRCLLRAALAESEAINCHMMWKNGRQWENFICR